MSGAEAVEQVDCFGARCAAIVAGDGPLGPAREAAALACETLLDWHRRFSRFEPDSELSRLNRDERTTVPVSAEMARLADAIRYAATITRGLVDGTLLTQIEQAGYRADLDRGPTLARALELAPVRAAARPTRDRAWEQLSVDLRARTVTRPPGLRLDSGGLGKGLFADMLAERMAAYDAFAIDCGGDVAIGGAAAPPRRIKVESPFSGATLHTFELRRTGVATSGIGRRSWLDGGGRAAHHLLDPATGRPAFSGVVQATALAPSATLAEIYAKAALLSGPRRAAPWLRHGGVAVLEDGSHELVEPLDEVTLQGAGGEAHSRSGAASRPHRLRRARCGS